MEPEAIEMDIWPAIIYAVAETLRNRTAYGPTGLSLFNSRSGNLKIFRWGGRLIYFVLMAVMAFCSAVLIALTPWRAVSGWYGWVFLCLVYALGALVMVWRDTPGFFWMSFLASPVLGRAAIGVITTLGDIPLKGIPVGSVSLGDESVTLIGVLGLVLLPMSLIFLPCDTVGVGHPLARLVHFGRWQHLKAIQSFACQHHWDFMDPSPIFPDARAHGAWRGRDAWIGSGRVTIGPRRTSRLLFQVALASRYDLWPLQISDAGPLGRKEAPRFLDWLRSGNREREMTIRLSIPDGRQSLKAADVHRRLEPVFLSGGHFIAQGGSLQTTGPMVVYHHQTVIGQRIKINELESLLEWMSRLIANMEMDGFTSGLHSGNNLAG